MASGRRKEAEALCSLYYAAHGGTTSKPLSARLGENSGNVVPVARTAGELEVAVAGQGVVEVCGGALQRFASEFGLELRPEERK